MRLETREALSQQQWQTGVHDPSDVVEFYAPVIADATGRDTLLASKTRRKAHIPRLDKTAFFAHFRFVVM